MNFERPSCEDCGGLVDVVEITPVEDELRSTPFRQVMRAGAVWHTCENGHRVMVTPDLGPQPLAA